MTVSLPVGHPPETRWDLRLLDAPEEMAQVEALQRIVWPGDDLEVVPAHVLLTAAHNGGLVAGAFWGDTLAGFVWGFPGLDTTSVPPHLKHCSHQLGVRPDFRSTGVGFALKCFQREFVLAQHIDRITWTYDPLLARNARLNIARLGAVCDTYLVDLYGELRDGLNAGLPTDRFQVDWWITSPRVAARVAGRAPAPAIADLVADNAIDLNRRGEGPLPGLPAPDLALPAGCSTVLFEIPGDFLALKAADPDLALQWRLATRCAFQLLFGRGFAVTDFVLSRDAAARAVYVLTRGAPHAH